MASKCGKPQQNYRIGKVFELAKPHFAATWSASSTLERFFPIATETAIMTF